jgi:phage FluMu protein gp41
MKNKRFTINDGQATITLNVGLTLEGVVHKDVVMNEATVADILDAENDADVSKPLNFSAQLMLRQLVSIGTFTGPFTFGMIGRLKPNDFSLLRSAQAELGNMGEYEPADSATS